VTTQLAADGKPQVADTFLPAEGLRERLRAVLPRIAANAERGEQERRIPDENIALLQQVGFTRTFQPKLYGGLEMRVEDYGYCLLDLAEACGPTAWVGGLLAQHVHALALFSREMQDELWLDTPDSLVASSVAPVGKSENVPGGVMLSGRFGFSSGCDHADWFMLGFVRPGLEGVAARHYAMVPRADVTIVDDWFTEGLRATGSKTLLVDTVFVPEHRIEGIIALNSGKAKGFGSNDSPIYNAAFGPHFSIGFAAVAIGMTRRLAELYAEKAKSRIKVYTGVAATARAPTAMRLGRGVHGAAAALAFLAKDWRDIDARSASGLFPSPRELSEWRTNQAFSVRLTIDAADALFEGSGGSAWFTSNEMQRLWRNIRMCGSHAGTDYDTCSEIYGRNLLGLDLDPTL
jgi:alkylation response protein AidB-like acyl-CoA dehydrogenase